MDATPILVPDSGPAEDAHTIGRKGARIPQVEVITRGERRACLDARAEARDRRRKPGIDADADGSGAQARHQQRAAVWLATEADRRPDDACAAVAARLCPGGDRAAACRQARSGACDPACTIRPGRAGPASAGPDRDPAARERDTAGRFRVDGQALRRVLAALAAR